MPECLGFNKTLTASLTILSNTNFYTSVIRTILNDQFPDLKLISVLGYCGIVGNEDRQCRHVQKSPGASPYFFTDNLHRKDLMRQIIRHYTYSHTCILYRTINTEKNTIYDYDYERIFKRFL